MKRFTLAALISVAVASLSACMSEGIDGDSNEGLVQITHTTKGSVYWQ